jgi:magnesium-transporting ATPase (P-type)
MLSARISIYMHTHLLDTCACIKHKRIDTRHIQTNRDRKRGKEREREREREEERERERERERKRAREEERRRRERRRTSRSRTASRASRLYKRKQLSQLKKSLVFLRHEEACASRAQGSRKRQ